MVSSRYIFSEASKQIVTVTLKDLKQLFHNEFNNPSSKFYMGKNAADFNWLNNALEQIDNIETGKSYGEYDEKAFMPLHKWLPHLIGTIPNAGEIHIVKNAVTMRPLATIPIKVNVSTQTKKQIVKVPMSSIADGWNLAFEYVQTDLNNFCRVPTNTYDWSQTVKGNYPAIRDTLQFWSELIVAAICYGMGNKSKNVNKRAYNITKNTPEYQQALKSAGALNVYTSNLKLPFEIILNR